MGYWFVASPVGVEARLNGLELGIGMNRGGVLASGQSNVTLSVSVTGPLVLDAPPSTRWGALTFTTRCRRYRWSAMLTAAW